MLRILLVFVLLIMPAFAQQTPPTPKPQPTPKQPIPVPPPRNPKPLPPSPLPPAPQTLKKPAPKPRKLPAAKQHWEVMPKEFARPTKYILFLFDSSGSMSADQIGTAIEFVLNRNTGIAAAPFDDFYIALATFGTGIARWEGTPDINPDDGKPLSKYGWAAMPSLDNLNAGRQWISTHLDGGNTNLSPGISHCFNSNSGKDLNLAGLKRPVIVDELTILIITDGEIQDNLVASKAIETLQKERKAKDLAPALIGFVGIQVTMPRTPTQTTGHTKMLKLAKDHAELGYLRIEFIYNDEDND